MRPTRVVLGSWSVFFGAAAGCDAPIFANELNVEIVHGERSSPGGMCTPIGGSPRGGSITGGGTGDQDLQLAYDVAEDGLTVDVKSQGRLLEHREYSERQLRSGKRDQFTVTTSAGHTYELTYWGSDECESPTPEMK